MTNPKTLSPTQHAALKRLWTAGIARQPVHVHYIDKHRATLTIARALERRGLIAPEQAGTITTIGERVRLTPEGRRLTTALGWGWIDATPSIAQRKTQLETAIAHGTDHSPELELLIGATLETGRRQAAELLERSAGLLEAQYPGDDTNVRVAAALRHQAAQIRALQTRVRSGEYSGEVNPAPQP